MSYHLITKEEVLKRTSINPHSLRGMWERNLFPKPVKLSAKCIRFVESEVQNWLDAKMIAAGKTIPDQPTLCDDKL
ncbi:MAG: AlpA family phage regulatory protein [Pseudomonadota bacterium]